MSRSQSGQTLVLALVGTLAVVAIGIGFTSQYLNLVQLQRRQNFLNILNEKFSNFAQSFANFANWQATAADPRNDPCFTNPAVCPTQAPGKGPNLTTLWMAQATPNDYAPTAPNGIFRDQVPAPNLLYDEMDPSAGFDFNGNTCRGFNAAQGNPACPMRFDITFYEAQSFLVLNYQLRFNPGTISPVGPVNTNFYSSASWAESLGTPQGCNGAPPVGKACNQPYLWFCEYNLVTNESDWICGQIQ